MRIKVVKEIILRTHCRAFCAVFGESDGVAWRLLSQDVRKWKEKDEAIGDSYATGRKIEFDQKYPIPNDR
jgi:hypothetical protein